MDNTLKVLCIEDSQDDYFLIQKALKRDFPNIAFHRVHTAEQLLASMTEFGPDIVLSDHNLPQFNSADALKILQSHGSDAPFVLVTGAMSDDGGVLTTKQGADDYVLKSNLARLSTVMKNVLKQKETQRLRIKTAAELARRNEELSRINRELDSFAYSVSHNLRAPLKSLLGLLEMAKSENDANTLHQYHEMMQESISKLDSKLSEILEYSRNARQEVRIERVKVRELIEETFESMAFMQDFKNFTTEITVTEQTHFYSDRYRLSVILNNLISNSIKYYDRSKPVPIIRIKATVTEDTLLFEFSDNGIGIEKHALSQIFDMFYRASQKGEGSGLGLFIVKEAVELLKGTIEVTSTLHSGTTFMIEVPNAKTKLASTNVTSLLIDRN